MGLHDFDGNTIAYHCQNGDCPHHNCANWEPWLQCATHDTYSYVLVPAAQLQQGMLGQGSIDPTQIKDTYFLHRTQARRHGSTIKVDVTDANIVWTDPSTVALPSCSCGTTLFLKVVFSPSELAAPNMIINGAQHPMVDRHQRLAAKLTAIGNVYVAPK